MYTNLPTSQGYIFRILQHFATKLSSFSNFDNFFPKISFVIPRLKILLKRKSSISKRMYYENYFAISNQNIKYIWKSIKQLIKVDNVPLKIVDHAKILGQIISNSLQLNLRADHVIKKANKRLYCLVQLKRANVPEADIVNFSVLYLY
jgi:hypothetical protein